MTGAPAASGIDLGGTKIAGVALASGRPPAGRASHGRAAPRLRRDPPRHWRDRARARGAAGGTGSVGIGMPGLGGPRRAGCVQNANSTWLNGKPFATRPRGASWPPGAARQRRQLLCPLGGRGWRRRGRAAVFGVILGTGCGGGLVFDGSSDRRSARHRRRVGPQPAALGRAPSEHPGPQCWCGRAAAWRHGSPAPASRPITLAAYGGARFRPRISPHAPAPDNAAGARLAGAPC